MLFLLENLASFAKKIWVLLILIPCTGISQGISNNWISGYACGNRPECGISIMNFYSGFADTSHSNIQMSFSESNANISDSAGNLLFYTNGIYIANAFGDTMLNGDSLNPSFYVSQVHYGLGVKQGDLILPMPGYNNLYYLFHETLFRDQSVGDYRVSELYYSIIDMSLDSGRGAITQKNVILLSDTLTIGSITACKHANGRDWWIVVHKSQGRRYYEYLLSPLGLQGPYIQDIGYSILPRDWSWQACFSPDGNKYGNVFTKDTFDIMDFDRCTGLFSNCHSIYLNDSANARGLAFASNSQLMYVTSAIYMYQFNINATPIDSSKFLVGKAETFAEPVPPFYTAFYLSQIMNDNKIYISCGNSSRIFHVINHPNQSGLNCDFLQHSFQLPTYSINTIPNFPNYFLGRETGSICDSLPSIIWHTNGEQERHGSERLPVRLISDNRGIDICPIRDDYDEKKTYQYFLRMTSESIMKPE